MIEWILNENQLEGKALETKLQKIESLIREESNEQRILTKYFA